METIQNIFIDSLNGFALDQIPLFLFQLLCAGMGAHLLQIILNKKVGEKLLEYSALISISMALLASIVKYSVPTAIVAAAVILLLLRGKEKSKLETIGQLLVVLIGVGCGVGNVIQTILGCVIIFTIILFTPIKNNAT